MPSGNTGNKYIIKSLKIYHDHVTLAFFSRKEQLKISKEAYLSSYLYEGKTISKKELQKLKDLTALSTLLTYALSLVSKRHYSEFKIREKLKKKDNNYTAINEVINKLKVDFLQCFVYNILCKFHKNFY